MEIIGVLVLLLDIYAIYNVVTSGESVVGKLLWSLGIIVFPVVGFIAWMLVGPKGGGRAVV
ncbi:hypothetical protein GCM10009127_15720 [Alteraurantiacibacter aestuarii]|uniref:Cardiolipin synthase N-terminal domain-containing protein n=1 Tax=Alteraurantiacibacter aestuarii TaxID=650004 RepID=A0A844ZKP9_9SPHN|nr:PLD nuclease N-terminal domain-containing protein [Alteraurantiacibacter aestuarii]MXO87842.1 hypothetical protein [Alteraurantiacibacter aestuarii]